MLRSIEARNSYVNCHNTEKCYEYAVVSRENGCQTSLLPILHHKRHFAYEYSSREALAEWEGAPMEALVDRSIYQNFGNIRDSYVNNRDLLER